MISMLGYYFRQNNFYDRGDVLKMAQKIKQIKFKYLYDKSYNPSYCTGGFGGTTPKNEIVLNFFMERQPIPYWCYDKTNFEIF